MKLIPGLLVTALAVPLTFASAQTQSGTQTDANQRDERGGAAQTGTAGQTRNTDQTNQSGTAGTASQSGTTGQTRGTDHTDHDATSGTAGRQSGAADRSATSGRTDRTAGHSDDAGTRSRTAETESRVSPNDRKFMTDAAQGGMAEVQLAQLAQEKASSDEVKELARMIEQDHQKANDRLKEIAATRNVDLPAEIGPKHKQLMTRLQAMEGAAFDRAYTEAMVKEHRADVKKFQKQSKSGLDTDVREFAENTLPDLQKHLQEAQQRQTSMRSRSR